MKIRFTALFGTYIDFPKLCESHDLKKVLLTTRIHIIWPNITAYLTVVVMLDEEVNLKQIAIKYFCAQFGNGIFHEFSNKP